MISSGHVRGDDSTSEWSLVSTIDWYWMSQGTNYCRYQGRKSSSTARMTLSEVCQRFEMILVHSELKPCHRSTRGCISTRRASASRHPSRKYHPIQQFREAFQPAVGVFDRLGYIVRYRRPTNPQRFVSSLCTSRELL